MKIHNIYGHNKSHYSLLIRVGMGLLSIALWTMTIYSQDLSAKRKAMPNLTDEEVITALGSHNRDEAHEAVEEVIKRGERMIPSLLGCKGIDKYFYGYWLGGRSSGFLIPLPAADTEVNDGSFITVEVAALYLISAIYYKTLEFAQAPYLTDGTPVEWQKFNTPERVSKAWDSVESWMRAFKSEGIESLRSRQQSPLSGSKVHFWGRS